MLNMLRGYGSDTLCVLQIRMEPKYLYNIVYLLIGCSKKLYSLLISKGICELQGQNIAAQEPSNHMRRTVRSVKKRTRQELLTTM